MPFNRFIFSGSLVFGHNRIKPAQSGKGGLSILGVIVYDLKKQEESFFSKLP